MCTVHLHYTPTHKASVEASKRASDSFTLRNWNVELVAGYTKEDVIDMPFLLQNGKTHHILKHEKERLPTKLAILQNHLRFWQMVADSNKTQIYAEHDVFCVQEKFTLPSFEDVLLLNLDTRNMWFLSHYIDIRRDYPVKTGLHNLPEDFPWVYNFNTKYKGSRLIPTASCYALTPQGARKLLQEVETSGAEQGDMMINTSVVDIKYLAPALITQYLPITASSRDYDFER